MFQDLRFGLRMLLKHKSFTLVAVLTLALGIGANTAIFSVVNALMLKPLPYPDAERLVWVDAVSKTQPNNLVWGAHFLDWQEQCQTLAAIAAYTTWPRTLTGAGEPELIACGEVSASFFPLLGVQAFAKGRNFTATEDASGGERVAILSYGLWQQRFSGDQEIVGKTITLNDANYAIVGVLPAGFRYFRPFELWLPLALNSQAERGNQQARMVQVIARLKPSVTHAQTRTEMETIRQRYETTKPAGMPIADSQTRVVPLHEKLLGETRRALWVLLGAVGLILLIACANVANLSLARALGRQKELAIRAALGAGRWRLARQMLIECLLLAVMGGAAGLVLAYWLTRLLGVLNSTETIGEMSDLTVIAIDRRVFVFALIVSLLTGLLCGSLPALHLARPDLNVVLKEGARGSGLRGRRWRGALMVSEVALAMMLLIGAGLLVRSFVKLLAVDPGFQTENLLTARLTLPPRYQEHWQRAQFYEQILQHISALPGVTAVGATSLLPLTTINMVGWLRVEGRAPTEGRREPPAFIGAVNADYFRVMGIGLRAGRLLNDGDQQGTPSVALLSEALARKLFPNEDPLGKRLFVPSAGAEWTTVVGIVGDVRHKGLERALEPAVYLSYRQAPPVRLALAIRGAVEPMNLAPALRKAVQAVDPALPLAEVMTMDERLANSIAARRFNLLLLGVFAALALVLAGVGVYGVIAFVVTQRTHEVGIRLALGAQRGDVLRLFIKQGMWLVLLGVALGLLGALVLTRVMAGLLFGVSASDPLTFAGVALLLLLIALLACYLPARRATKVDPLVALRHE